MKKIHLLQDKTTIIRLAASEYAGKLATINSRTFNRHKEAFENGAHWALCNF